MKLLARECLDLSEWDRHIEITSNGLLFHLTEWLNILADVQQLDLKRYAFFDGTDDGKLVGMMPVFFGNRGPLRIAGSPLVLEDTPYLGPVIADYLIVDALRALVTDAKPTVSFLRLVLYGMLPLETRQELQASGFTCVTKHTHRISLDKGIEAIWKGMEGRCRTAVRRAEKSGVEVVRINGLSEGQDVLKQYYRIAENVFARQGLVPPNSYELFHHLWERFYPKGMISLFMARMKGQDIAGVFLGHYKGRVYYLDGASDRNFSSLNASNLLLWRSLQWAKDGGYREFDFVGSDIPRLAEFKASFGGELVTHTAIEWARSPLVMRLRNWYGRSGRSMMNQLHWMLRKKSKA